MSSITARELKALLDNVDDDCEVIMNIHHKHDIPEEVGRKGWYAYINGFHVDEEHNECYLMN